MEICYGILFFSSPAIGADGTIYIGSEDNNLYAFNPDGSLQWQYLTSGSIDSSPAIAADGTIYVGSDDHYLYAFSAGTPAQFTITPQGRERDDFS